MSSGVFSNWVLCVRCTVSFTRVSKVWGKQGRQTETTLQGQKRKVSQPLLTTERTDFL